MDSRQHVSTDKLDQIHWDIIDRLMAGQGGDDPWGYGSPSALSDAIGEPSQDVQNRLRDLRLIGIVDRVSRGFYRINPEEVPD